MALPLLVDKSGPFVPDDVSSVVRDATGQARITSRAVCLSPTCRVNDAAKVTAVHSVAGLLAPDAPLITAPPFVAPHHTSSVAALVGGGSGLAKPGAISRAHRGCCSSTSPAKR